jgi:hypothetical protein
MITYMAVKYSKNFEYKVIKSIIIETKHDTNAKVIGWDRNSVSDIKGEQGAEGKI